MTTIYCYDYSNDSDTDDDEEVISSLRQGHIDGQDPAINPDEMTFKDIGESSMGEAIMSTEEFQTAVLTETIYKISSSKSNIHYNNNNNNNKQHRNKQYFFMFNVHQHFTYNNPPFFSPPS